MSDTMIEQTGFTVTTTGRGTTDLTGRINQLLQQARLTHGTVNVFLQHTSASLIITENADPAVRRDLERLLGRLVPDGDPAWEHDDEGPDDMAAHGRAMLTGNSLTVPFAQGQLLLGTWQGIYLFEHRTRGHVRHLVVTLHGE